MPSGEILISSGCGDLEALYPNVARAAAQERNLLWLVFTDPDVVQLLPDWETDSRHFLAQFRAEAGARLGDPGLAGLVSRLLAASPAFRDGWESHSIEPFTSRERRFHHPLVGGLRLEHHRLAPSDHPELHVVIYTPADPVSAERLERLRTSYSGDQDSRIGMRTLRSTATSTARS